MARVISDDDIATAPPAAAGRVVSDDDVAVDHQSSPGLGQQVSDFFSHAWNGISSTVSGTASAIRHPLDAIDAAHDELKRSSAEMQKGKDEWKAGNYSNAIGHWKLATPILGPMDQQMQEEAERGQGGAEFGDFVGLMAGAKLMHEAGKAVPEIPGAVKGAASGVKTAAAATADAVRNPANVVGNLARNVPEPVTSGLAKIEKAVQLAPGTQDAIKILPGGSNIVAAANTVGRGARTANRFIRSAQGMGAEAPPVRGAAPASGVAYPGAQDPAAVQPRTPIIDTSTEPTLDQEAARAAQAPRIVAEEDIAPSGNPAAAAESPESLKETPQPKLLDEPAYERPDEIGTEKPDYQAAAQKVKGRAIGRFLANPPEGPAITAEEAGRMTDQQWHMVAKEAGVNAKKPPSPETRQHAIEHMQEIEARRAQRSLPSTEEPGAAAPAAATLPDDGQGQGPAAAAGQGVPPAEAPQPGAEPGRGTTTSVRVPGQASSYPAEYRLRELKDLQASHNGLTFQRNPEYRYTNDRDYAQPENQGKVVEGALPANFDPAYHVTDNPDLTNGPPLVDSAGNALGGNGRTMQMQRVYAANPKGAAAYRDLLTQKAGQFGIDPADVAKMKQPVLVREIADEHLANPQNAITDLNKTGTAALKPAERAIADSRRVSQGTLDDMATRLEKAGPDATLPKLLAGNDGPQILGKLVDDGVVAKQELAAYLDQGKLTKDGQQRISKLMLGRFFRDPAQLDTIPSPIRTKIERLAGPLAKLEGAGEWSLMPTIREALDLIDEAHAHGTRDLTGFLKQTGLYGETRYSPDSVTMAKQLQRASAGRLADAVKDYGRGAQFAQEYSHAKAGLFAADVHGEAPTPRQSFDEAFGYKSTPATTKPAAAAKPKRAAPKSTAESLGDQFTKD